MKLRVLTNHDVEKWRERISYARQLGDNSPWWIEGVSYIGCSTVICISRTALVELASEATEIESQLPL